MGLDMYLYARREFAKSSNTGQELLRLLAAKPESEFGDEDGHSYYLSRWDFTPEAEREAAMAIVEAAGLLPFHTDDSAGSKLDIVDDTIKVSITCAYWRKANAIHNWFVTNCQEGVDECQVSDVHPEQLAQLRDLCLRAVTAYDQGEPEVARSVLTPTQGFFFGGTEVDDWYAQDLRDTAAAIERVVNLAVASGGGVTFHYHSSW